MNNPKSLLMRKRFVILFPLVLSVLLHLVVVSSCSLQITAKGDPSFYSWFNILSHQDLFLEEKEVVFPESVNFSSDNVRREYFSSPHLPGPYLLEDKEDHNLGFLIPKITKTLPPLKDAKGGQSHFYLWERGAVFSSWEEEDVSYRAYVSPYGKVLFLYPERLPVNSYGNLYLQKYLREATFFLDDRFFWTKLEGVVK